MFALSPAARRWIFVAGSVLMLALLLWLPYRVPIAPSFSDSYLFGFNNRMGMAIIGAFVLFVALVAPEVLPSGDGGGSKVRPLTSSLLRYSLLCVLAVSGALYLATRKLGGYNESAYLIDRVKLVLAGMTPNRDFEYAYGPLFVYGPAWITHFLHLPVSDGYGLFWIAVTLTGLTMTYFAVEWIDLQGLRKRRIFLFFVVYCCVALIPNTGVNYSLFRFVLPCFLALAIYRRHATDRDVQVTAILLTVPAFVAVLAVSPELAVSFALGMAAYFGLFAELRRWMNFIAYATALLLMAGAGWLAARHGLFDTLNAFRTGGFNFPIVPGPHVLLLLLALCVAAAYAVQRLRTGQGSALLMLISISAASTAGALGRCDPVHALMNPLGITLAAMALLSTRPRAGKWYLVALCLVYLLVPLPFMVYETTTQLSKARSAVLPQSQIRESDNLSSLHGYTRGVMFETPFGFAPTQLGNLHSPQIDEGFFFGKVNLLTPAAVDRKVAELQSHPERPLLLLAGQENSCAVKPEVERFVIQYFFLVPYRMPVKHAKSIHEPICAYIREHYHVVESASPEHFGYAVWAVR